MITAATQNAFEAMTEAGSGDAGALAVGLRQHVTGLGLRALAAKTLHVAAAAPERLADIYDNASAGWLSGPVFPPRLRTEEPLPIPAGFWKVFWELVAMPAADRRVVFAERMIKLSGELNPGIHARVAAAALEFPGVREAAAGGIPDPYSLERLGECPPASLGYAFHQDRMRAGDHEELFDRLPLRAMPPPLDYTNIRVLQCHGFWTLVAGYGASELDQIAMGGFLMAQFGHHYSALFLAVTMTTIALERPQGLELALDSIFKGWTHGRDTPPLIGVPWESLWRLRVDQVRETLGVTPFDSPYIAAVRQWRRGRPRKR